MQKLGTDFYERDDVVQIARELLGKYIITTFDQQTTVGRIVETEAYAAVFKPKTTSGAEISIDRP